MTRFWKIVVLVWPLILVVPGWRPITQDATKPTRIAVVDRDAIVLTLADQQGTDSAILAADAIADRLSAEGFVVLDRRHVLRAPTGTVVQP